VDRRLALSQRLSSDDEVPKPQLPAPYIELRWTPGHIRGVPIFPVSLGDRKVLRR